MEFKKPNYQQGRYVFIRVFNPDEIENFGN